MFHKGKLLLGMITGIVVLLAVIEVIVVKKDNTASVLISGICMILIGYADARWTLAYLEKHPEASWRRLPTFKKDAPILNVYCLNFYKWLLVLSIAFFLSAIQ